MTKDCTVPLRTGRRMPALGLGTWQLTKDTAGTVEHALGLGWRMIDTACDYGSQAGIGRALKRTSVPREEIYLVAKVEENDDAYQATRRYLGEMQTDYADLVLIHRPPEEGVGELLWEGLARARDEGLARDIGVSNYSVDQMRELAAQVGETPVVNQVEWSPFGYSERLLEFCRGEGIVLQAYSPLTRAMRLGETKLAEVAERHGRTSAQVLLRWNLQRGTVPLPKANRRAHLHENLQVFDFELSAQDMRALDGLNAHWSSLGSLPYV
jgi:2,5-diketo-D-gluconate reductase A